MKYDLDKLDLRPAFRDEPEKCHQALLDAVRSIKEEEKNVKHLNFRPLLIAAIIIVSMLSVAFAASEIFGLSDYFQKFGISLTPAQQDALKPNQEAAWQVGPITFTLQERVADPYYAYISTRVDMTDGSQALLCMDPEERLSDELRTALNLEMVERDYGSGPVLTRPTYQEAAQQTGLPLYSVRAILKVSEEHNGGEGMEYILHTSSSGCVYINQQYLQQLDGKTKLDTQIFLRVSRIDPATCEETGKWSTHEPYTLPLSKLVAEGHYIPETPLTTGDMTLTHIDTKLYETGLYAYRQYQMPADMARDIDYPVWDVTDPTPLTAADGTAFMRGIGLLDQYDTREWPTVTVTEMLNLTELPEIIQVGGVHYKLQSE